MKYLLILMGMVIFSASVAQDSSIYFKVNSYEFGKVDTMVKYIPKKLNSISEVCEYINCHTTNDLEKVRSVYMWIHYNIVYNEIFKTEKMTTTELWEYLHNDGYYCFKYRRGICSNISRLFKDMTTMVGIKSRIVEGICKQEYTNGLVNGHAWNVVEVYGTFIPIDVTWGIGNVKEWFLISPEIFIFTHFPLRELGYTNNMMVKCPKTSWVLIDGRQLIKYSLSHPEIYDIKNQLLENKLTVAWFMSNIGFSAHTPIKYNTSNRDCLGGRYLIDSYTPVLLPINKYPHILDTSIVSIK